MISRNEDMLYRVYYSILYSVGRRSLSWNGVPFGTGTGTDIKIGTGSGTQKETDTEYRTGTRNGNA